MFSLYTVYFGISPHILTLFVGRNPKTHSKIKRESYNLQAIRERISHCIERLIVEFVYPKQSAERR